MSKKWLLATIFLSLTALLSGTIIFNQDPAVREDKSVLIAILAKNKAHTLPTYLKCIDNLDYDKKNIVIYINTNNNSDNTREILEDWVSANRDQYKHIDFEYHEAKGQSETKPHEWNEERFKFLAAIRQKSLQKTKEHACAYYFVVDCDNFIAPYTLKDLVSKDKPIIAPVLYALPEIGDTYSNFFLAVSGRGYFGDHPDRIDVTYGAKVGTFQVPLVHCTYLVKACEIDKLTYLDGTNDYEFAIFARSARNNGVDQYICNEKEYGVLLHFHDDVTLKEEQARFQSIKPLIPLSVLGAKDRPITSFNGTSGYTKGDLDEIAILKEFTFDQFKIQPIENLGSFYIDNATDPVKNDLRQGKPWEPHLVDIISKYAKPGTTVVDIGAHIGTHTVLMANSVGEKGKVVAFEPQMKLFSELFQNTVFNHCQNVSGYRCALGAASAQIQMDPPHFKNQAEFFPKDTLDSFHLQDVSFIRIDMGNDEEAILAGAKKTINRNRPVILIKIMGNSDKTPKDSEVRIRGTIRTLQSLGYTVKHISGKDWLALPNEQQKL